MNLYPSSKDSSDLLHRLVDRVSVIFVSEGHRPDDYSVPQPCDRHLVAELVLHMVLALADAEHVRFVERVDLVPVIFLPVDKPHADVEQFLVGILLWQAPRYLSEKYAGNGAHPLVGPPDFLRAMAPPSESLRQLELLDLFGKGLMELDALLSGNVMAVLDNLVEKLGVRRKCHVLLLHRGVDEGRLFFFGLSAPAALAAAFALSCLPAAL